jgi:hypothetical protein
VNFVLSTITDCKPDKAPADFSGNVRKDQMIVGKRDAEHRYREH